MRANITVRRTVAAALAAPMLAFVAAGTADAAPQTTASLARPTAVTNYVQGGGGFGGFGPIRGNYGFFGGGFVPVVVPVIVPVGGFNSFFPFR
ncbi:hypothetical protein [Actinacidiphila sp. bgisy160]|uniref:hypothetical protein n=1 Tax=Actinacidiphila sp. bgisy160 TaxID=3413796 RepID=UPI003D72C761